jgi:hypothetical protein
LQLRMSYLCALKSIKYKKHCGHKTTLARVQADNL